jgi:type I restriction enzyme S subunit
MMEGWNYRLIADICDIRSSTMPFKEIENVHNDKGDLKVLAVKVSDMNLEGNEYYINRSIVDFRLTRNEKIIKKLIPPGAIVFPKRGAAIATNKKRLLTKYAILDPNLISVISKGDITPEFLNFFFQSFDLKDITDNNTIPQLNKKDIEPISIPCPSSPEQRKIAHVLSKVQKAIEQQDKLIRTTTELKKALMQKLFTEGTRGEPKRETEIGLVPESWEIVRINEVFNIQQGKQVSKSNRIGDNQKSFLRTANIFWGKIDFNELDEMHFSMNEESKFTLLKDDLLVCEGGDVGRTAICGNDFEGIYYQNHLHRLRAITNNIIPRYFMYWMMYFAQETSYVKDAGNRTTIPNLSKSRLGNLHMPLPNIQTQKEITDVFLKLDDKITFQDKKKQTLTDLFKTLLHELMTGQRRVHELEFDGINIKVN